MASRRRPTAADAANATRLLLDGLAAGRDLFDVVGEVAPLHPRYNTFPGEVFLRVGADALQVAGISRQAPLDHERFLERLLSECEFRGRDNRKIRYALLAVAAIHGGVEPDLLDEVVQWHTDDFWEYALFAAAAYIRAAAERQAMSVQTVCQQVRDRQPASAPGH